MYKPGMYYDNNSKELGPMEWLARVYKQDLQEIENMVRLIFLLLILPFIKVWNTFSCIIASLECINSGIWQIY